MMFQFNLYLGDDTFSNGRYYYGFEWGFHRGGRPMFYLPTILVSVQGPYRALTLALGPFVKNFTWAQS